MQLNFIINRVNTYVLKGYIHSTWIMICKTIHIIFIKLLQFINLYGVCVRACMHAYVPVCVHACECVQEGQPWLNGY